MSDNEGSTHEAPSPAASIEHEPSASEAEEEDEIAEVAAPETNDNNDDIELGMVENRSRKSSSSSSSSSKSSSSHKKHKKHKKKVVRHVGGGGGKGGCWIACIMIVAFFSIAAFMIYKFFSETSFSFSSSSSSFSSSSKSKFHTTTWSGDFTGEYKADFFKDGEWSAKSDTRSSFNLAYRLASSEDRITIEKKDPRAFDSYTVYIAGRTSGRSSYSFTEGVPFRKSRPEDSASVQATIKIKGSEWKEKHEGKPKVEIKREFTDSSMKVTYTVDKAVYVKRFEKV